MSVRITVSAIFLIPAGYIADILLWGWGMVSSYVVGYIVFLTATGLAFRPIWQQERLEAKTHLWAAYAGNV